MTFPPRASYSPPIIRRKSGNAKRSAILSVNCAHSAPTASASSPAMSAFSLRSRLPRSEPRSKSGCGRWSAHSCAFFVIASETSWSEAIQYWVSDLGVRALRLQHIVEITQALSRCIDQHRHIAGLVAVGAHQLVRIGSFLPRKQHGSTRRSMTN